MRWFRWLNPLIPLVDHWREKAAAERAEREADRKITAAQLDAMQQVVLRSLDASKANTELFGRFLDTYNIAEPPKLRTFDEEEDDERYIRRKQSQSGMPAGLQGLSRQDQFKAILENLDKFNAGD